LKAAKITLAEVCRAVQFLIITFRLFRASPMPQFSTRPA
jgi:hypothetical protein